MPLAWSPRRLLVASLAILVALAGCMSAEPADEEPATTEPDTGPDATPAESSAEEGGAFPEREIITPAPPTRGTFTSRAAGFTLQHPLEWEVLEGAFGGVVMVRAPAASPEDAFQENLNVVTEPLPDPAPSLDAYVNASIAQLERFLTDFELHDREPGLLGDKPAVHLTSSARQGTYRIAFWHTLAIEGDVAFVVTYTGESDASGAFLDPEAREQAARMVASWSFADAKTKTTPAL